CGTRTRPVATTTDRTFLRQLGTLFRSGAIRELTDGQLLVRFSTGGGEAAESAFAALVERHGAMVLRVCRAHLADPHDIQDAFQATFLILVQKARALWVRESLGPWLHQVAVRTASCARTSAARRRRLEQQAAEGAASLERHDVAPGFYWEEMLHAEINRLPECYRVPIVLCDLQGHTCEEVARRLGRPVGTVKSWRSRGRKRLRSRLIRLGLAPSAGLGSALAADVARAAGTKLIAEELGRMTVQALARRMTTGKVSASGFALVKGVHTTMFLGKLRMAAAALFALVFLAAGFGAVARVGADDSEATAGVAGVEPAGPDFIRQLEPKAASVEPSGSAWPLALKDAIRIGLRNSEVIQVIEHGPVGTSSARVEVARRASDIDPQRFKSEVMAQVRAIEQQYWNLAQQ